MQKPRGWCGPIALGEQKEDWNDMVEDGIQEWLLHYGKDF